MRRRACGPSMSPRALDAFRRGRYFVIKVVTPREMLVPVIMARMVERHALFTGRIRRLGLIVLVIIAAQAGKRLVLERGSTAAGTGEVVLDGEGVRRVRARLQDYSQQPWARSVTGRRNSACRHETWPGPVLSSDATSWESCPMTIIAMRHRAQTPPPDFSHGTA